MQLRIKSADLQGTRRQLESMFQKGQLAFGHSFKKHAEPYVPLKYGPLRGTARVVNGGRQVEYIALSDQGYPYSIIQFYTQFDNYTTPGTGPRWDLMAQGLHMQQMINDTKRGMQS